MIIKLSNIIVIRMNDCDSLSIERILVNIEED